MALSSDLISQFVKVTNDKNEPVKETTAYGTIVVRDGKEYVKLDGSELLTPISSTTVVKDEDRVMVTIKNHTAIVTGDLTSPSASNKDVTDIGDKITEVEILMSDKIVTQDLEAINAFIENIKGITAEYEELSAITAEIETLQAKYAEMEYISATDANILNAEIENLKGKFAEFTSISATDLEAINAEFTNLQAYNASFTYVSAEKLDAISASIKELDTDKLDAETAKIIYATIDFANINEAAIEKLFSDSGIIKDLIMSDGKVTGELVGVTIKGDLIEGNTLKADKLVILGEDGLYYKLNVNALGETTASSDPKYQNGLDGSVIVAESITAEKIAVDDLVAFGATIGGFHINNHAIYSGVKNTINNTTRGVYLGDDGQVNIGDQNNFLKYYMDENGKYKLEIQADTLRFGSSNTTIEEYIKENVDVNFETPVATKTVEGTEIIIDDGKQIVDFIVEGKSTQKTRSGINQLMSFRSGETSYFSLITTGSVSNTNFLNATPLEDNWIRVQCDTTDREMTAGEYINFFILLNKLPKLKTSTTYTFVVEFRNQNITQMQGTLNIAQTHDGTGDDVFRDGFYMSSSYISSNTIFKRTTTTYDTFASDTLIALRNFQGVKKGDKFSYDVRISVLEGDYTNKDYVYESFGASPSPEYPSEIESVGYENYFNKDLYTYEYIKTNDTGNTKSAGYWDIPIYVGTPNTPCHISTIFLNGYTPNGKTGMYVLIANYYLGNDQWVAIGHQTAAITDDSFYRKAIYSDTNGYLYLRVHSSLSKSLYDELMKNTEVQITKSDSKYPYIPNGKTGIEVIHMSRNLYPNSGEYKEMGYTSGTLDTDNTLNGYPSIATVSAWSGPCINLKKLIETTNLKMGDEVTYSIYFKTNFKPTRNMLFTLYRASDNNSGSFWVPMDDVEPGKWIRIKKSFTLTEYSLTRTDTRLETDYYDTSDPYYYGNNRENKIWFACPQLEKGSEMTDWTPQFMNSTVLQLNEPLRSLPNGVKDIAKVQNGVLYVERKVDTITADGVNVVAVGTNYANLYFIRTSAYNKNYSTQYGISDHFVNKINKSIVDNQTANNYMQIGEFTTRNSSGTKDRIYIKVPFTTVNEVNTWLSENPTKFDYELAEPYLEEIGPVDIQLDEEQTNTYYVNDELEPNIICKYNTEYSGYNGQSVYSVTTEFYLSNSKETLTGGEWTNITPNWTSGKYVWTRSRVVYVNPYEVAYTQPICDSSWEAINVLEQDLQEQLDGKIQSYSQNTDPSVAWTTIDIKNQHTGDIWYNPDTKKTQRWSGAAWVNLENAEAQAAATLAGKKAQVFTSQPTIPYYKGDLWITALNKTGVVKTCQTSRTSGSYTASDWVEGLKYTDDTVVNNLSIGARNLLLNSSFSENFDKWNAHNNYEIVEKNGYKCAHINYTEFGKSFVVSQSILGKLEPNTSYTMSGWVLTENLTLGTTNPTCMFYQDGNYNNNGTTGWYGFGSKAIYIMDKQGVWNHIVWTFTTDEVKCKNATTSNMFVHTRDIKGDVYFRHLKLEKGNKVTDWTPAPEDIENELTDTSTAIYKKITDTSAEILVDAGKIVQKATETLITKDEFGKYKNEVSTTMETAAEGVFIELNKTNEDRLTDLEDTTGDVNKILQKYFTFTEDGLTIGSGEGSMKLRLDNEDGIIFEKANGDRVGYWDGENFYTGNIVVRVSERAQFGNYAYLPKTDGSLVFTRVK